MKKILFPILLLSLSIGTKVSAQDTFDDKRHTKGTTSKSVQTTKFNYPKIQVKPRVQPTKKGRSNFQMSSVLALAAGERKYSHSDIKKNAKGTIIYMKSRPTEKTTDLSARQGIDAIAKDYLDDISPLLGIDDGGASEFSLKSSRTDALGQTHLKMQQLYKGVKVYGSEIVLHLNKKRQVTALNGRSSTTPKLESVAPVISLKNALIIVGRDLGVSLPQEETANENALMSIPGPEEELLVYPYNGEDRLVRHLTVFPNIMDRWEYFVDATTGEIVDKYYHTCTMHVELEAHKDPYGAKALPRSSVAKALPPENSNGLDLNGVDRQIDTYSENGTNYMLNISKPMYNAGQSVLPDNPVGGIITFDLRNKAADEGVDIFHVTTTGNSWDNPTGVSAHYNADVSYEYFRSTFNRSSFNDQGGTIISFINVADSDTGEGLDNAFWNGKAMFYGNGDVAFSPLAGALDVGAHELSHGVIRSTANLEYRYQSGAINESFADIFGAMVDRDDWKLAEDIVNTDFYPSGAMRDMQNPNNGGNQLADRGWQPKDMTEYYDGEENNGGTHINSGIVNRAYYLIATDIGKDKAEQIYYKALVDYLTVSSQFIDLRIAVAQSATDLHGEGSLEVQAVQNAFDTVGILDGPPTDTDDDIPTVITGDDFILSYDVDSNSAETLYISNTQGDDFSPLTTTKLYRRPSVANDGSLAIYVTEDNTINAITLDPNNPEETIVSEDPIWAALSISKDGTKFAAVKNDGSNVIFILDLVNGGSKEFELYNPTSEEGVTTGEVLYPDALEWDHSGQYLMYDALNRFENGDGDNIEYWDVGFLKVWDNQANTYGDGTVQKLFTGLPEGASIGNPSFSKTSGNIVAFDFFDSLNDKYTVIATNIETGTVKTVYENNKLGFPNYSKTDDKLIFDTNNGGDEDIVVIDMEADKISPSGNATELIPNAKWGIWYTVGSKIFSLPADNFKVLSKGKSCAANNNGSVQIEATANYNYTATITGNGADASNSFTNTTSFDDLQGGQYTICITVEGQVGYENCFDVVISEPEPLSVISKINLTAKEVTLDLSGGDTYTINLNEEVFTTSAAEITLPLQTSAAKLTVKTDKECQGVYEENIDLNHTKIIVYPNPVQSGDITVQLNTVSTSPIMVQLNSFDGRSVFQGVIDEHTNELKINADMLQAGMYLLTVQIEGKTETFKIIKQ